MKSTNAATVVFRVDASLSIGTGHVMRCLALADALKTVGVECRFICREHDGNLIEHIRAKAYHVYALPRTHAPEAQRRRGGWCAHSEEPPISYHPPHVSWLGCDWELDASETGVILSELQPHWLVVDHYALDARWEQALRGCYEKLLVIDDLANRTHISDVLLDQNLGREVSDYDHLVPRHCVTLAGPRYALLRPEFAALRERSLLRRETPTIRQLLVTMGGVDSPNVTSEILKALKNCPLPSDCRIVVVMGARAPWLAQVRELAGTLPWATDVRVGINDMAQVMADSDLAIGAAGSTSWERCCLGLPTLLVVLADNQRAAALTLEQVGAAIALRLGDGLSLRLSEQIQRLVDNPELIQAVARQAANVTDGRGCERVIASLLSVKG